MKKFIFRGGKVVLSVLLISVFGIVLGFSLTKSVMAMNDSRFEQIDLFSKVLDLIETQYYRKVDNKKLIQGAIKGMMETLDPHSTFLSEKAFTQMKNETSGEFGGLGIEVTQKDGHIYIITPIDDTPAFRAGLKAGDRIVEINGDSTNGLSLDDAVDKMRGASGSKIILGILRKGSNGIKTFELVREKIKLRPVKAQVIKNNFAYIRLTQFQANSGKYIAEKLEKMKKDTKSKGGIKGIVFDLRANPGGLLDEAVKVSSIFLKDGVVVSTEGRDPKNKEIRYVLKQGYKDTETPLIVLINGASASASEIVAGALQDHQRALIAGAQSFGKGSVQTLVPIDENRGVKLTIQQYMTPNGRKIQAVGIRPDIDIVDINSEVFQENVRDPGYIRERDLRNHLTSTIETEEEKKQRLQMEKEERLQRQEILQQKEELRKLKKENDETVVRTYDPNNDFQVLQAINYLKTFKIFKKLHSINK